MANVTKPIALNETFKTTESTSRNLADVLAQALQALNTTISGLNFINATVVEELPTTGISTTTIYLVPSDDPQSENIYDEYINLDGTSAGWEKIGSTEIDLSNYYTKPETDTLLSGKVDKVNGKGLSTNDYTTAEKTKLAGIEAGAEVNPTSGVKTATESFETVDGGLLSKCMIDLVPVQSGSGDPYPAGGGKNKLPLVLADIKLDNTSGVWNGNTYTIYNTTFTVLTDDGGNVLGIKVNGKPVGGNAIFYLYNYSFDGTSITLNGCPSGGSSSTYRLDAFGDFLAQDIGSGVAITNTGNANIRIVIFENVTVSNVIFYPMIRLSTVTDPTFAPYSNVRPISGHTEVDLYNVGKNLLKNSSAESDSSNGITWKKYADGSVEFSGTATANTSIVFNLTADSWYVGKGTHDLVCSVRADYNPQIIGLNFQSDIYVDGVYARTLQAGNATYTFSGNRIAIGLSRIYIANGTVIPSGTRFYPQIEFGTSPSAYEPYQGKLYTVQIGSIVYGGYVNLVTGVMTVTHEYIEYDGSEDEEIPTVEASSCRMFIVCPDDSITNTDLQKLCGLISNRFKEVINSQTYAGTIGFHLRGNGTHQIVFSLGHDSGLNTPAKWRTWLSNNPIQVVYPLANPFTVTLTPQQIEALPNQNNLSTPLDGQSIETNGVEYKELFTFADVKEYVGGQIDDVIAGLDTLVSSVRAWAGDTLKFTIPQSNTIVYHFVAMASGGTVIDAYIIKRVDSVKIGMISTQTITATYSDGILTIVLPQVEFWNYSMTIVKSRY